MSLIGRLSDSPRKTASLAVPMIILAMLSGLAAPGALAQAPSRGPGNLNVKSFGAVCDGAHDDTRGIQSALDTARKNPDANPAPRVMIPDNCVSGPLTIGSNQWIEFDEGATLRALPGAFPKPTNSFLTMAGQHDVTIKGHHATVAMNRNEYTDGEWRHGVLIYQSKNVQIDDLKVTGAGGDGFAIAANDPVTPENISLINVAADSCTRNGIAVISGRNITIKGATLTNTSPNGRGSGTRGPWAGLDIEPNGVHGDTLQNIAIQDLHTSGNHGAGLQFTIHGMEDEVTINVSGLRSVNDGRRNVGGGLYYGGILFATGGGNPPTPLRGQILIEDTTIESPNGSGVLWRDWSANEPKTVIRNITIHNPGAQTSNMNRCGLYYNVRDTSFGAKYASGSHLNVEVDGVVVKDDRNRVIRAVWFEGDPGHPLQATVNNVRDEASPTPRMQIKLR
jgi:polygalacturonase